ncbi:hypothetical protein-putative conserved hypothetical protein [Rhodopirellula baltica SH 1]|uniref:Uncharacterized protein n=1 Tax=Rhodopirellula baltica (strain DSM 10527 / NCIMB 13988 / SH1) TaxID=243090 RepID=Q7UZE3_RHOBA|nr:hypothetical protein-putative conserved hypothetical protein [Rhodopirellula baltica SH 1]
MLWNRASRPAGHARLSDVRPFTQPGTTWPTSLSQPDASARDTSEFWRSHQRRQGHYLAPSRCFGTKRAVQPVTQGSAMSVHSPRQVQPGLHFCPNPTRQRRTRLNTGEATNVGQVITWHPADALEQSGPSSRSRKTQRCPSIHPARYNLAYIFVPTRRVSERHV